MTKETQKFTNLLERVCRRLLRESVGVEGLAAFVREVYGETLAVLYDPESIREHLVNYEKTTRPAETGAQEWDNHVARKDTQDVVATRSVKGMINVRPSRNPCWGAWEVVAAAAPGGAEYARLTYGIGYALSPSGTLMSDRKMVSQPAKDAWMRIFVGKKRSALEFDDIKLPRDQRRTPDFPDDDCTLYRGASRMTAPEANPQLQYAYKAQGWEKSELRRLVGNHEAFMDDIEATHGPAVAKALERLLAESENEFFHKHYPGSAND